MPTFKHICFLLFLFAGIFHAEAQTHVTTTTIKTATFVVAGNCEECKARIENAADIKGVKLCVWDVKTHIATVTYNESKTSLDQVKKAIAAAGHDIAGFKADDASYKKLPSCCKYRDAACTNH